MALGLSMISRFVFIVFQIKPDTQKVKKVPGDLPGLRLAGASLRIYETLIIIWLFIA